MSLKVLHKFRELFLLMQHERLIIMDIILRDPT